MATKEKRTTGRLASAPTTAADNTKVSCSCGITGGTASTVMRRQMPKSQRRASAPSSSFNAGYIIMPAALRSSFCCRSKIEVYPPDQSGGMRQGRGSWWAYSARLPRTITWSFDERMGFPV